MIAASEIDKDRLLADALAGKFPDARGRFGPFGGRYVPETLVRRSSASRPASTASARRGLPRGISCASSRAGSAGPRR